MSSPAKDINPDLHDAYWHIGVDFKPAKPVDLALVYKHENVRDGTVSIGSGDGNTTYTVGGTQLAGTGAHTSGQYNEVGVYTQWQF